MKTKTGTLKERIDNLMNDPLTAPSEVEKTVATHWHNFKGSGEDGMHGHKLHGRMEEIAWSPPVLKFAIERHGGTMCGSTRAELQHWEVDLDAGAAEITKTGSRQLEPMAPRVSVKEMAEEIAQAILTDSDDKHISRSSNGTVKIRTSAIFPTSGGFKRTVEGRRMRLCKYIEAILTRHSWRKLGWNKFSKAIPWKEN